MNFPSTKYLIRIYLNDPLKIFIIFLTWFIVAYGARIGNDSPLTYYPLEAIVGQLNLNHIAIMVVICVELIRRTYLKKFQIPYLPYQRENIILFLVMVMYPMLGMFIKENQFRIPYEIVGMPVFILSSYLWAVCFEKHDLYLLVWIVFFAGLFKSIEGILIYFTIGIKWGLLTGWRDGLLQCLMVAGAIFAFAIKPNGEKEYLILRRGFFIALPFTLFTFINSIRRTFMLSLVIAILTLMFSLPKKEMVKIFSFFLAVLVGGVLVAVTFIDSEQLTLRITNMSDPSQEGSSAYRLIEVYNVWNMVKERPFTGYPMGTKNVNYTNISFENVSSLMPHNTYLYMLYRAGVWGLLAWLLFLFAVIKMHYKKIKNANNQFQKFIAFWLASATIAIVPAGFVIPTQADKLEFFLPFIFVMASFLPDNKIDNKTQTEVL